MLSAAMIVVGVLTFSALLGWMLLRSVTAVERARRDARYRRRLLLLYGGICAADTVFCVALVVTKQPLRQIVSGLVMDAANVLFFFQLLRNLRTPPAKD